MTTFNRQDMEAACRWGAIALSESVVVPNIVYKKANGLQIKLDVILAGPASQSRPTVIYFHGGGWVMASKEDHFLFVLPYLARGMNVVNVEYRSASDSLAPAAVEDCRCALRWVFRHAEEYGFDISKLVLFGESAGGHLSLMTAMLDPSDGFDNDCPTDGPPGNEPLKVAAVVAYCAITDVAELLTETHRQFFAVMWFGSLENRMELAKRLSPLSYVRSGLPPTILVHGDDDEYVPYAQGVRMHEAMDQAGVPNILVTIPQGKHWVWPREQHFRVQKAVFEFLENHGVLVS